MRRLKLFKTVAKQVIPIINGKLKIKFSCTNIVLTRYKSARDAVSKYPERCTAIAARLQDGELELFCHTEMRIFLILLFSQHLIF